MTSRAILISSLFTPFVAAFTPVFSSPSQCGELKMSWASFDWELSVPEIFLSLVPTDKSVDPYYVTVPCGQGSSGELTIQNLPFPGGTQFYADAFGPGLSRRQVSTVFSVEGSMDSSCLNHHMKRQVNVVGTGVVDANAPIPSNEPISPSSGAPVVEIGPAVIPLNEADLNAANTVVNNVLAPASSNVLPIIEVGTSVIQADGSLPTVINNVAPAPNNAPIVEVGTSEIPADGTLPTLSLVNNVAPLPTDAPPIVEVGTSLIPADGASTTLDAFAPGFTDTNQFNFETTSCTSTQTDFNFATATTDVEFPSITNIYDQFENSFNGTEFTDERGVVHFGSFQDLVNAANEIFKAWNPLGFSGIVIDDQSSNFDDQFSNFDDQSSNFDNSEVFNFDQGERTYGYPPATYTRYT